MLKKEGALHGRDLGEGGRRSDGDPKLKGELGRR